MRLETLPLSALHRHPGKPRARREYTKAELAPCVVIETECERAALGVLLT